MSHINGVNNVNKVLLSLQPSVVSQLTPDTVDTWTRVCRNLYTCAKTDLSITFTDIDNVPVDEELVLGKLSKSKCKNIPNFPHVRRRGV